MTGEELFGDMMPCPFCGNKPGLTNLEISSGLGVTKMELSCSCGVDFRIESDDPIIANGTRHQLGLTAIDKWNKRAAPRTDCPWK